MKEVERTNPEWWRRREGIPDLYETALLSTPERSTPRGRMMEGMQLIAGKKEKPDP